jgi:hypothetical protein
MFAPAYVGRKSRAKPIECFYSLSNKFVRTLGSFPTANQRVPHISPAFGEMWETRTSTSFAHTAAKFR